MQGHTAAITCFPDQLITFYSVQDGLDNQNYPIQAFFPRLSAIARFGVLVWAILQCYCVWTNLRLIRAPASDIDLAA